ncbi:hypothetical protein AAF712_005655 [Marasmius tenuissimus]|uniref:Uncharacterized protein n=1 Tax=Marasmius tenuissimus TaxID=585030 RepID=A0ABR3A1S4_9AGAR
MSATFRWYSGSGCTGSLIATSNGASSGQCVPLGGGRSAKSIRYDSVPNNAFFYRSGGPNDNCRGSSSTTRRGSGCATAPDGFNWQSVRLD